MKKSTKKLTAIALFSAIAFILTALIKIPISPLPFLRYDPKDVIIVIGGFIYSPIVAVAISTVVSLIEMFTISESGIIGLIMNILSTCAFALPAIFIYRHKKSLKSAILGLIVGTISMTIVMLLWNYILTPLYTQQTRAQVATILFSLILPFNLIKAGLNSAVTLLIYKPIVNGLRSANLAPEVNIKEERKQNIYVAIGAIIILFILAIIVLFMLK